MLDRYAVTNRDFRFFVRGGGYQQEVLWAPSIWHRVSEFVDSTGSTSPRSWRHASYPADADQLPVVGVSWFEADAYARWVGKRLPTNAEWVKAAVWPAVTETGRPVQRRFPWGNAPDLERANLWSSGLNQPVAVSDFPAGDSAGGVHQLFGNVWEWTASPLELWLDGDVVEFDEPCQSIRGGAFDTYFDLHLDGQAQSGENPIGRRHNIGFRCAVSACDIVVKG